MLEDVRLIIWDLDETLWRGTLTEGGIREHIPEHYDLIRTLNRRGIMNSICSKNNYDTVKAVLDEQGIWTEFVFPSISWESKGNRIASIIASMQLRPESVLFIDDNPSNLAEARLHVPGLKTAEEIVIPDLLKMKDLIGKDDSRLTRLQQYKLLEIKQGDRASLKENNEEFLRNSDIFVTFEYDVDKYIDRVVELINRTNQLNYTKLRLPGDLIEASAALRSKLQAWYYQCALIHVKDKYGDYGFVGFYLLSNVHGAGRLEHFCFSCRTLGMGVERYVYEKLGRPVLNVSGEVVTDVFKGAKPDWISDGVAGVADTSSREKPFREIRLRGGCDLDALLHYLSNDADRTLSETNYIKMPHFIRRDTSTNLAILLRNNVVDNMSSLEAIGLESTDVATEFFSPCEPGTLLIFSAWADIYAPIYQNCQNRFAYCVSLYNLFRHNIHDTTEDEVISVLKSWNCSIDMQKSFLSARRKIVDEYHPLGLADESTLRSNWISIIDNIPNNAVLCVLLPNRVGRDEQSMGRLLNFNAIIKDVVRNKNQVFCLDITDFVTSGDNIQDGFPDHVHRMVYYRTYLAIKNTWQQKYLSGNDYKMVSSTSQAPVRNKIRKIRGWFSRV